MEKNITVVFNKIGNTVDVWFDNPKKEVVCEEAGDGIILRKDREGNVIGFEKLNTDFTEIPQLKFLIKENKSKIKESEIVA